MILRRLCEFAERKADVLPPPMYQPLEVKWQIQLDQDGTYRGVTRLSDPDNPKRGLKILAPAVKRTSAIKPLLIADKASYVLGLDADSPAASDRFRPFHDLVSECAEATDEPAVRAVLRFLDTHRDSPMQIAEVQPEDNIIFRVGDIRPTDLRSVSSFWVRRNQSDDGEPMQCLICGGTGQVDRVSPVAIKGIPGGQSSGMALISANAKAFESYGAEQALIAPTCRICGEAYANAINYMIRDDNHHVTVGPSVFIFWTAEESGFNVCSIISRPEEGEVKNLIESYRTGKRQHGVRAEEFYALSLSASAGRVVVRDWLDTTVPAVQTSLGRWFDLQGIVEWDGSPGRPFGVYALAASLYLKPNDQMVANVPRSLVRCALSGGPLPDWLLAQAVNRNRAEQSITRPRAALIKAVLLSQRGSFEEGHMEQLDSSNRSPGYLCGRLLAELEAAQKAAVNPRATLVDRYYGAASAAPATVFGFLLRDFQVAHMAKLRKTRPGAYSAIDARVQEILSDLREFPKVLTLKEQALFSLGYYHQKAANRAAAIAHSQENGAEAQEEQK